MTTEEDAERTVREVIGGLTLPRGERAREVVAEYGDGTTRREIEVAVNERFVPQFYHYSTDPDRTSDD